MYKTILLALDGISADRTLVEHIKSLAKLARSRVVLLHVDDGMARIQGQHYPGAAGDIEYLKKIREEYQSAGIHVELQLAYGDPGTEIVNCAREKACELVVMNTPKRRSLTEIFFGTTAGHVQESISSPVLLLRSRQITATPVLAA